MTKKIILPILVLSMTMLFSSCGKNSDWDVTINDENIEFPCEADDLGGKFKLDAEMSFDEKSNGISSVALMNGDDLCGLAKVEAKSKSDVDDDTDIHGITFLSDTGETNLKIDGVGNGSTKDEVISKLGQPENSTSAKGLKYTSGDYTAVFMIDDSDTVYGMGIYDKEANGDN